MNQDGFLLSSTKSTNLHVSAHSNMDMMQRQAHLSNYKVDHLATCIPLNRQSRLISKKPHKIRIIHLLPPEIIYTDKANFRNLVQSLTGRSSPAPNPRIKKHQMPKVSSSYQDMTHLLDSNDSKDSSYTKFNPNKLLDDSNHKQINSEHGGYDDLDLLIAGFDIKVEKDEMMVQAAVSTEREMQGILENGFCIDEFLELGEWCPQEEKFPDSVPYVGSNLAIDLYGEF